MRICPSYTGPKRWYDHNVKKVSMEDFMKGNKHFKEAERLP